MITFNPLDRTAYTQLRFDLIRKTEGVKPAAYLDGVGIPTIGIGFNLKDDAVRELVLDAFKVMERVDRNAIRDIVNPVTPYPSNTALQTALNAKMAELQGLGRANRAAFAFTSGATGITEMRDVFDQAVQIYDGDPDTGKLGRVDAWLANLPDSAERAVLVSLAYNGLVNAGTSPGLKNRGQTTVFRARQRGNRGLSPVFRFEPTRKQAFWAPNKEGKS
ncbi:MAG: hypothetical protein Q8Q28_04370 [Pseudomonadota bacterium]|nr:hypothetical protein [Pseudomonadota bacterium]